MLMNMLMTTENLSTDVEIVPITTTNFYKKQHGRDYTLTVANCPNVKHVNVVANDAEALQQQQRQQNQQQQQQQQLMNPQLSKWNKIIKIIMNTAFQFERLEQKQIVREHERFKSG